MKKFIQLCVCVLVFMGAWQRVDAQRSVFMVHGISGNVNTMAPMDNFLAQSRSQFIQQPLQGYNSTNGIQNFKTSFDSQNTNATFDATNYAICYDAGGVMMHERDQQGGANGAQGVKGYIMLGTPLNGSRFHNPARIGAFQDFIANGVYKVTAGPVSSLVSVLKINLGSSDLAKITQKIGIPWAVGLGIEELIQAIVPLFDFPANTVSGADVADGGSFVNALGTGGATSTPKIAIFGSEAGPTFWRALAAASDNDANDTTFQSENGEGNLVTAVDVVAGLYYVTAGAYGIYAIVQIIRCFWGDFSGLISGISNAIKAKKWLDGGMWLEFKGNKEWNVLIGSQVDEFQVCYTEETVHCSEERMAQMRDPSACVTSVTVCSHSALIGENDGVLSASTQTGAFNPSMSGARPPRRAENCNHTELARGQRGANAVLEEITLSDSPFFTN